MNINSSKYIKNNIQNVEAFKFFQNSPKRKTSPESKENKPIVSKLPLRSTRLKSVIHVESFKDLLESEYDITKENFDSAIHEIGAFEKITRLPKSNSNKINDVLNRIDMHLDNTIENKDLNKESMDENVNAQQSVDDLINSIDTDAIVDMVSLQELRNSESSKSRDINKCSNHPESSDVPVQQKKRGCKPRNLNNSMNNGNGILNYFKVRDKKRLHELSNASITPDNNKQEVRNLEELPSKISNASITPSNTEQEVRNVEELPNNNFQIFGKYTDVPEEINKQKEKQNCIQSIEHSRKRGRPPNKRETITENKQINNSQPKKRGRPPNRSKTITENIQVNNSQPKKRGRPSKNCKTTMKSKEINKSPRRETKTKPYTEISKMTKSQIKAVNTKKIPKDRLMDALDMIDNDDHPIWEERNTSCNPYIYHHWEPRISPVSDQNSKLKYARQFLLRRDWISLSKILCYSHSAPAFYYPLLSKYAALLLAHTDKDQFEKLIQLLTRATDTSSVMKRCTNIVNESD